jgi:predicted Zn-dependent protease
MAEFYLMTGDLNMASNQLTLALGLPGLDAIQRARYSARLEQVRAAMPKNHKNQVADDNRNGSGFVIGPNSLN